MPMFEALKRYLNLELQHNLFSHVFPSLTYAVYNWCRLGLFTGSPISKYGQLKVLPGTEFARVPNSRNAGQWAGLPIPFIADYLTLFDKTPTNFRSAPTSTTKQQLLSQELNKFRRNAASSMLNRIQKSSHSGPGRKTETLELLCVMLGGFLQPILHKLAQLPDANSTELGRQGLSVLLPLIRWDSDTPFGRRIQMSSMAYLTSS